MTIPLNNDTAQQGTDCPETGGPYWHFVISPNNNHSAFVEFHLNLGDATTYDTTVWIENSGQADNVFVQVPAGKTLTSLNKTGSTADISFDGTGTTPDKFQLSHTCAAAKKQPHISTTASTGGVTGDTFKDTATLTDGSTSPAITGTIRFRLYKVSGTPDCSGAPLYTEDVTVDSGNGDYTTATGYPIPTKGTYTWTAEYIPGSDANNLGAGPTTCGDPKETSTFDAATPDVETQLHAADHSEIANNTALDLGSKVHDRATVTGPTALGTPGGRVDFRFYNNTDCSGDGTAAGTINPLAAGDPGVGIAHPSTEEGALAPGNYGFRAFYVSSDENKWASNNSLCEPFTVNQGQLTADTILHTPLHVKIDNGSELTLGSKVHDTAQITGAVDDFVPTGAVTFKYFTNGTCTGDGADAANIGADESTSDPRTADTAALAPGSYSFQATVAGDTNYLGDTSGCEPFTVKKADLTAATKLHNAAHGVIADGSELTLGSKVHDTAQITGQVSGFVPANAVTFTFYTAADCGGSGTSYSNLGADPVSDDPYSAETTALTPGSYGFKASIADDTNYNGDTSDCEPFTVKKADLTAATKLHNAAHGVVAINSHVALGTVMHDTAQIGGKVAGFDPANAVTFTFYKTIDCTDAGTSVSNIGADSVSGDPRSDATAALAAGSYGFKASIADDTNYNGATSDCEPFYVDKGTLTLATKIHDANHAVVTFVPVGGIVHDTAQIGNKNANFAPDLSKLSFTFYNTIDCTGAGADAGKNGGVADSSSGDPRSDASAALASGSYSYLAAFAGDDNYKPITAGCEPLSVRTFGKTMGYWGNRNGQARIPANFTYTLGQNSASTCYLNVTKANTATILPNTKNGVSLLTTCTTVASRDSGINTDSMNVLLAQALALKLNIDLVSGFNGQQIGAFGAAAIAAIPTTFPAGQSLTSISTVQQVLDYANYLIAQAKVNNGVVITQAMIGQLNSLLGLINAEA